MSQFIKFKIDNVNFIITDKAHYFLLVHKGQYYFVNNRCPHRGGPLHLGRLSGDGKKILCPMHNFGANKESMCKKGLPCIHRNGHMIVLIGKDEKLLALKKTVILVNEGSKNDAMCFARKCL
ncbi:MAG: Rieske 2Fe-2S domain-containing protein [Gammaproteobacteria bacterium]|nr:Rieske 2Fe-2S domain-containing protein [Gammaproteobacteria bacterium]